MPFGPVPKARRDDAMLKMFLLMYVLAGPTLAGILMIVALVLRTSNSVMLGLIAAGFILAIPVSWYVAKVILENTSGKNTKAA